MTIYELDVKKLEDVKEVKKLYRIVANELATAEEDLLFDENGFYNSEARKRVDYLSTLLSSLRSRVYELTEPALSDEDIDLYLDHGTSYTICEHDKTIPVGTIEYLESENPVPGNIFYTVKKEYRGNNYALRALRLVGRSLLDRGVTNIFVTATNSENTPSIKTIEEFGGKLFPEKVSSGSIPYTCDLEKIYSK